VFFGISLPVVQEGRDCHGVEPVKPDGRAGWTVGGKHFGSESPAGKRSVLVLSRRGDSGSRFGRNHDLPQLSIRSIARPRAERNRNERGHPVIPLHSALHRLADRLERNERVIAFSPAHPLKNYQAIAGSGCCSNSVIRCASIVSRLTSAFENPAIPSASLSCAIRSAACILSNVGRSIGIL
jgi:hypothetical protein